MSGSWRKLGVVWTPNPEIPWMATHVGPSFPWIDGSGFHLFVTGRSSKNESWIGRIRVPTSRDSWISPERLLGESEIQRTPVFGPGPDGQFDESGVSYPWIVEVDGDLYMYYVGWVNGGKGRFQNFIGMAVSTDGGNTFERASRVPILDRTESEPFGSGSCCVWRHEGEWRMLYTSFDPWTRDGDKVRPCYRIREAVSGDGLHWERTGRVVIDFEDAGEYVIGRPMILRDDRYRLWYSFRGSSYRIGYAESIDGIDFVRSDQELGLGVSETGWDSKMVEYGFVVDIEGHPYMLYNGNGFGATGLGVAQLVVVADPV